MPWLTRGLRNGIVTSHYPRRPDGYRPPWRGAVEVLAGPVPDRVRADVCPTGAITVTAGSVRLDRGRCILCGQCVRVQPDLFAFTHEIETARLTRPGLVVPVSVEDDQALTVLRAALRIRVSALRRSVHIRHVDAGSDGAEEWEIAALLNPVYDVHRLGIFFTASPRHADILLVTGIGTSGMAGPLAHTRNQLPDPVVVIAAGVDAVSGGLVADPESGAGIGAQLAVDVWVPGSPPSPFSLLHAILLALDLLPAAAAGGAR